MRWEEMPKGHTSVAELVKQFETHCRLEGKPETTCRWYREILNRFLEWAGDIRLGTHPETPTAPAPSKPDSDATTTLEGDEQHGPAPCARTR